MEKIRCMIDAGMAVLKIDDGKANTMNAAFFSELNESLDRIEQDAKMLVIAGRKGFFSAGLDLKYVAALKPRELNDFTALFAKTLLRVYLFPLPTVAACTGHAIAGGAMLAFACDLRIGVGGPYRLQVNEVRIGIPLPSWMLLLGSSAVPAPWRTEALLHGRPYAPEESFEKGIFNSLLDDGADVVTAVIERTRDLQGLQLPAYANSKKRLREKEAGWVLELLNDELPFRDA